MQTTHKLATTLKQVLLTVRLWLKRLPGFNRNAAASETSLRRLPARFRSARRVAALAGLVCLLLVVLAFTFNVGGMAAGTRTLLLGSQAQPNAVNRFLNRIAPTWFPIYTPMMMPSGPGGVAPNLALWLRADAGVTGATSVSQWTDQSPNGNNAVQSIAANQAAFQSNSVNFNPALSFDGANDYYSLNIGSTLLPTGTTPRTVIAVAQSQNTAGFRYIIGYGANVTNQGTQLGQQPGGVASWDGWSSAITSPSYWAQGQGGRLLLGTFSGTQFVPHGTVSTTGFVGQWMTGGGIGRTTTVNLQSATPHWFDHSSFLESLLGCRQPR